ncbi:tetratricopeptide repeat protein [Micromonosporaceae bacterium B7E4]
MRRDPEQPSARPGALAERVRHLRERALLTQEELARRSGVSEGTIRRLESGRITRPRTQTLRLLADALSLTDEDRAALVRTVHPGRSGTGSPTTVDTEQPAGAGGGAPPAVPDEPEPAIDAALRPAQLPTAVAGFVGRAEALKLLDETLRPGITAPSVLAIASIVGTAGVGKTALAVYWAHQVRDRFPDGQLYLDLRGFDPARSPVTPAEALTAFLDALRVPPQRIPDTLDAQVGLFRSLLADRQMLLVLDNARDAEQVRPLLPGSARSLVLVTSRNQLSGLVVAEGARLLPLNLLSTAEARELLTRRLGADRLAAEPAAVEDLLRRCAGLPLALAVVAARAAAYPDFPLASIVDQLREARERLDTFVEGEERETDLWSVFSWSYRTLDPAAARLFRLLGLHPCPETDGYAAAALAGTDVRQTRRTLDRLVRAHLVQLSTPGRYGMHDLMRGYAGALAASTADESGGDAPDAALGRLFDHYLGAAAAAMEVLHPAEAAERPQVPRPRTPLPELRPETARRWLDAERRNLVLVAGYMAEHGWPGHTVRLAGTLHRYLDGGHYADALTIHGHARDAARRSADPAGEARALLGLAATNGQLGRYPTSAGHLDRALLLMRQTGDRPGEARILGGLGLVAQRLGRYASARERYLQALDIYRQTGGRTGETRILSNLGVVELRQGGYGPAADYFAQALARYREDGNRTGEAIALNNLGEAEWRSGRLDPAAEHLRQALAGYRQLGHVRGEASTLDNLGGVMLSLHRPAEAAEHFGRALTLFREMGDRDGETWVLNGLGEAAYAVGRPADAVLRHRAALALAAGTGVREQQARAHTGLGRAYDDLGEPARAREHYTEALTIYTELGAPDADDVRARLAALPEP